MQITAISADFTDFQNRGNVAPPMGRGWEYVLGCDLPGNAQKWGEDAAAKLKAKPDNGALEVEWEVDQNRNGQVWTWAITHDGVTKASGRATTKAPSGSFSVTRRVVNAAGVHTISGAARNVVTGEICRGALRI